jgi:krueppel-like factor 15
VHSLHLLFTQVVIGTSKCCVEGDSVIIVVGAFSIKVVGASVIMVVSGVYKVVGGVYIVVGGVYIVVGGVYIVVGGVYKVVGGVYIVVGGVYIVVGALVTIVVGGIIQFPETRLYSLLQEVHFWSFSSVETSLHASHLL